MFENVDGRRTTDDRRRTTDDGVTGILIAHLGAFGSGELKTIKGYLDSVPSLTSNTIKTLLIMHAFHSSRHLQSKWLLYFSHASMV